MTDRRQLRDLLYLDFDKAASIWSQVEGGLRERVSITHDAGNGQRVGVRFGIPKVAEAELGVDYAGKRSILETRILHHDILNRIDDVLTASDLIVDINSTVDGSEVDVAQIRQAIGDVPYLKATGDSVIEDYQRIFNISERFNEIAKFVVDCGMQSIKNSQEYVELQTQLQSAKSEIRKIKDHHQRSLQSQHVQEFEQLLKNLTPEQISVEKWLLDGIKLWISTFAPNRINFRVYPFPSCPSFQVICNLKRDCFVDQDPEHLLYGYGNRPNVQLSVFGLLTSIPPRTATLFDPMAEFSNPEEEQNEQIGFERAFRGLFGALDGMEALMRYSRYPNVTMHPIAVYRSFELK
jgi:hypothetical protein